MAPSSNRNPIDRYKKCGRSTKFKNSKTWSIVLRCDQLTY